MAVDAPLRDKRTRLTNHRDVLPHTDGRTSLAKRYKAIVTAIARDQGGAEQLSESRAQLVKRFAAASCLAELLEGRLVRGQEIDLGEHATLCSTLVRLSGRIGLDRTARDISNGAPGPAFAISRTVEYGHIDEHGNTVIDKTEEPDNIFNPKGTRHDSIGPLRSATS